MTTLVLTDRADRSPGTDAGQGERGWPIICPILHGLSAGQSDCAILMPRGNANAMLLEELDRPDIAPGEGIAAVLCADPFINRQRFRARLIERGVRAVTNWPSGIFFEGGTASAMAAVPAGCRQEIEWLVEARKVGLEAWMFVVSRDQGLAAIAAGINRLILHPGLTQDPDPVMALQLNRSLASIARDLRAADKGCDIAFYLHPNVFEDVAPDADWADHRLIYGVTG